MFNLSDTIAAICTPLGVGGIAAIRISGGESWEIAKKIFSNNAPCHPEQSEGSYNVNGFFADAENDSVCSMLDA